MPRPVRHGAPGRAIRWSYPLGPRMSIGVVSALREAAGGNRPLKPMNERSATPLPCRPAHP